MANVERLEGKWITHSKWRAIGWQLDSKRKANGWQMDGKWKANGWQMDGKWMANGWKMESIWMENGKHLDGKGIANGKFMIYSKRISASLAVFDEVMVQVEKSTTPFMKFHYWNLSDDAINQEDLIVVFQLEASQVGDIDTVVDVKPLQQ